MACSWSICFFLICLFQNARAENPKDKSDADCRTLISQAIEARGGKAALAKLYAGSHAKLEGKGETNRSTAVMKMDYLSRSDCQKRTITGSLRRGLFSFPVNYLDIVDGDRAWSKVGEEPAVLLKGTEHTLQPQSIYRNKVELLYPLLDGDEYFLSKIEASTIDGVKTAGVLVTSKEKPNVRLFFDKETHFLIQAVYSPNTELKSDESEDRRFSKYKNFQGVMVATEIEINRKDKYQKYHSKLTITELTIIDPRDISDIHFAPPK